MDDKSLPSTGTSIFQNLIKKIVKKVDNQSEFNPTTSLQQSIYSDQNQLVDYQHGSQQLYSSGNEQYEQQIPQSNYTDYSNYYTQQAPQTGSYLYAQTSTDFQPTNYDQQNQLTNLPPALDLNQQQNLSNQQIYQPNYSNYAQQTSPYFDQQWQNTATLNQQITPLPTYSQTQFNFNQYAQDNQIVNQLGYPPPNQFSLSNQLNNQQPILNPQLENQLSNKLNETCQINNQLTNQYSQPNQQQFNQTQQQLNSTIQNVSNVQNYQAQNISTNVPTTTAHQTKPIITSAAAGTIAPPLLNKIKQKMAAGSKMIASFKSSPTSDNQNVNLKSTSNLDAVRKSSFCSVQNQNSLNTEELTAHLTAEEKQILAKVFQKEEEFQRETSVRGPLQNITLSSNIPSSNRQSPAMDSNIFVPTVNKLGNCRICKKTILENEYHHYCDNCSLIVCEDCSSYSDKHQTKQWWCSHCRRRGTQPFIAAGFEDAISELSAPKYSQHQRRRYTMLPGSDKQVDLSQCTDSPRSPRSRSRTPSQRGRRPSLADTKGRQSSLDLPQENQEQLNQENAYETFKSLENDSLVMNQQKSLDLIVADRKANSFERTNSNELSIQQSYNNQPRTSVQMQSLQKTNNQLLERRRSSMSKRQPLTQRPSITTPAPIALPRTLDSGCSSREQLLIAGKLPRKSYSASDSSLDELLDPTLDTNINMDGNLQVYSNSQINQTNSPPASDDEQEESNLTGTARLSRSVHQLSTNRRSSRHHSGVPLHNIPAIHTTNVTNTTTNNNKFISTNETTAAYQTESNALGKSSSSTMLARNASSSSIRRPASARIRKQSSCFTYDNPDQQQSNLANQHLPQITNTTQTTIRRQSDSQGSEGSEPIDNSLSLSSPDYSRSPRQSADSDILGLPSMSPLSTQRRSIPSVLVDTADPNHLTLKDALNRRSSTGRALPKVPIEQSRSLLELPQKRQGSTHSLDLPNPDQPRRASAPEGENIKIVIDEVDDRNFQNFQQGFKRKQIERVILYRNHEENKSVRSQGFGLCICGGKLNPQDNQLYAIVAWVLPNSAADKMAVKPMDTILQWNGQSLINLSYEQVANIIANSGDQAELLIEPYIRDEKKSSTVHQKRRLSVTTVNSLSATSMELKSNSSIGSNVYTNNTTIPIQQQNNIQQQSNKSSTQFITSANTQSNQLPITTISASSNNNTLTNSSTANLARRKLPRLPETQQQSNTLNPTLTTNPINLNQQTNKSNQILIQCWLDSERRELVVNLICAQMQRQNINTPCFGQVRILPTLGFSCCKTELSKTMEWNETLIFKQFPVEKIPDMALEISVWEEKINISGQKQTPIGETVIPLESAIYQNRGNNPEWWPLLSTNQINTSNKPNVNNFQQQQISQSNKLNTLQPNQLQDRCSSAEYLPINQFQDKLDTKHLITESKSVPSSRRNSGHNQSAFQLQPNLQHNLSSNVLNVNTNFTQIGNQISSSQLNRRPSNSTNAIVTTSSNQYLNTISGQQQQHSISIGGQLNTVTTTVTKSNKEHLSLSTNHLTTLDPMTNYGDLIHKTTSVTLTTNTASNKQFLDVNNNSSSYNNLRRKSSSALSNAPNRFPNRTSSLRSSLANGESEQQILNNSIAGQNIIEQQQQQQLHQVPSHSNLKQQSINQSTIQQTNIQNSISYQNQLQQHQQQQLTMQNQSNDYKLNRQPSIQMRSSPIMKSVNELDKQFDNKQQINFNTPSSTSSISSIIATPMRRPSSSQQTNQQMQPNRCISAMETLRNRRPLSISANSCSSSDEMTDTESLSKAGTTNSRHEVITNSGKIIGELRLSIVMSKGTLDIEILEAKIDSTKVHLPNKPDTYIKTYLKEDGKRMYKKKTKLVQNSWTPQYKHVIKYTASTIYNRTLMVMLWRKEKGFTSASRVMGLVEIAINQMDLSKLTTDWYNLFEVNLKDKNESKLLRQQSDIV